MPVFSLSWKNGVMQGSANSVKGQRINISGSVFYIIRSATQLYYCGTKVAWKILTCMGVAAFQQTIFKNKWQAGFGWWGLQVTDPDLTEGSLMIAINKSFSTKVWELFYTRTCIYIYLCLYTYQPIENNSYNNATLIHFHSMYFPD